MYSNKLKYVTYPNETVAKVFEEVLVAYINDVADDSAFGETYHGREAEDIFRQLNNHMDKYFSRENNEIFVNDIFDMDALYETIDNETNQEPIAEEDGHRTWLITTIVSGGHGSHIPKLLCMMLDGPGKNLTANPDDYIELCERAEYHWAKVADQLNVLMKDDFPGVFYFGFFEADGSYCLFYDEDEERGE